MDSKFVENMFISDDQVIINKIFNEYKENNYNESIKLIDKYCEKNNKLKNNTFLREIYIFCYFKLYFKYKFQEKYKQALMCLKKILSFEKELIICEDLNLFLIYKELSKCYLLLKYKNEANYYKKRSQQIINSIKNKRHCKMVIAHFINNKYSEALLEINKINNKSNFNKGRYYMLKGNAYYYNNDYHNAIENFEKAISYYNNESFNGILEIINQKLNNCYLLVDKDGLNGKIKRDLTY